MKKRVISIILSLLVMISMIPISSVLAAGSTNIVVTADRTTAYPDDIVDFTVSIGAVEHLMGAEFKVLIPTGMTYVAGSTIVADGLKTTLGCASADWTESSMKFTMYGDGNYSSDGNTKILTFSCEIDSNTVGSVVPQITDVALSDTEYNEITAQIDDDMGSVNIIQRPVSVTGVSLNKNSLSLTAGDSETLVATVTPENATNKAVLWESSDSSVATVDSNGKVETSKKGTATITVATENGSFTDFCVVTVACAHANTTPNQKVEPTCISKGHEAYTICNECNEVITGADNEIPMSPHNLTAHNRVEPTHTSEGNIAYWECDSCHQYFSDAAGLSVINDKNDVILGKTSGHDETGSWDYDKNGHWKNCPCGEKVAEAGHKFANDCDTTCDCGHTRTIQHSWESTYSYNENGHWIECSVCGEKQGAVENHTGGTATCQKKAECSACHQTYGSLANHEYTREVVDENYLKSEATCKDFAVYYKSCSMCGLAGTETFNGTIKADHAFDNDCDTTCNAGCGYTRQITHKWETTYSSDDNKHWHECEVCGENKDEGNHTGGPATCKDKAVCEVCNKAFGELAPHNNIGKVDNKYLKSEATCIAKAVYYKSCSVCGTASTDTFTTGDVDSNNHTGNTEVKDAVEATCTTDGYSGDTYCKDCGEKLEGGEVISKEKDSVQSDSNSQTAETDSPKTGNYSNYMVWIVAAGFSLMIGLKCVLERKRNR